MKQFFFLAMLVVSANCQLLPILPTVTTSELYDCTYQAILDFQQLLSDGVVLPPPGFYDLLGTPLITFPDGVVLDAGIVALPLPFLCNITGTLQSLLCRLGSADCTYVHNTYSGKCALSPNPVNGTTQTQGQVFVCNDQNPTGYNFVDISDPNNCGPLLGSVLDPLLDIALGTFLRTRMEADLCLPLSGDGNQLDSTGCSSDCRNNHQYASGTCVLNATPTAVFTGEDNAEFQCLCSYQAN